MKTNKTKQKNPHTKQTKKQNKGKRGTKCESLEVCVLDKHFPGPLTSNHVQQQRCESCGWHLEEGKEETYPEKKELQL